MRTKSYGPVSVKNILKYCEICGETVYVKSSNTHAVCSDWSCQARKSNLDRRRCAKMTLKGYHRRKSRKNATAQ